MTLALILSASPLALADNEVDIDQTGSVAGGTHGVINYAGIVQIGSDNEIEIEQVAGTYNELYVYQQGTGNQIDVEQEAGTYNYADLYQKGYDNEIELNQHSVTSYNYAWLSQHACWGIENVINVEQDAYTYNYASIEQDGYYNKIVGASTDGTLDGTVINDSLPATQDSSGSYNQLTCFQSGDYNKVGLYQEAAGYNYANISQTNGNNYLAVYQINPGTGCNEVIVEQPGDASAKIYQENWSPGGGVVKVTQN